MSRASSMRKRRLSRRFGEEWRSVVTWLGQPVYNTFGILPYFCKYILCSTTSMTQLATSTSAAAASPPLTPQPSSSDITTAAEPRMATTHLFFTADEVGVELRRLCPNGVCHGLLKECAAQLVKLLLTLFNLSFKSVRAPVLWKTSCLVLVPKIEWLTETNDYRLVALTSHSLILCYYFTF